MALHSPRFAGNDRLRYAANNDPPMRKGERGEAVRLLQQAMIDCGFSLPLSVRRDGSPDGIYGNETFAGVRRLQAWLAIPVDGVAGRKTLTKLDEQLPGTTGDIPSTIASLVRWWTSDDYIVINTSEGVYAIDPALVKRIAYKAAFSEALYRNARRVSTQDGWGLPTTYHYELDYPKAKQAGSKAAFQIMATGVLNVIMKAATAKQEGVCIGLGTEIRRLREHLEELERRRGRYKKLLLDQMQQASRDSMRSIEATVDRWDNAKTVATIVRDVSADVFLVAAGALSGGTALAAAGAGAFAKGAFKYQDTENLGAATLTAVTSLVIAVIPVKANGSGAQHYAMAFAREKLDVASDFAIGLAEGKTALDSALDAGFGLFGRAAAGRVVRHLDVKDLGAIAGLLDDKAIPLSIRARMNISVDKLIRIIGAETTKALADQGSAKLADAVARKIRTARYSSAPASAQKFPLGEPGMAHYAVLGANVCTPMHTLQ